jgi:hypothetical protein
MISSLFMWAGALDLTAPESAFVVGAELIIEGGVATL